MGQRGESCRCLGTPQDLRPLLPACLGNDWSRLLGSEATGAGTAEPGKGHLPARGEAGAGPSSCAALGWRACALQNPASHGF